MRVYVQSSLMNSRWQRRIQALCKPFRYDQFARNLLELHIRLKRLFVYNRSISAIAPTARKRSTHLEQLLQERYKIRPFLDIVKRVQTPLHLLRVFLVFWVGRVVLHQQSWWSKVDGPAKGTISSNLVCQFGSSTLTIVGNLGDCRLLGEVRASGLHAQSVDVEIHPKEV